MGWFAAKALGLPRYLWILIVLLVIVGAGLFLAHLENVDDANNQQIGAQVERETQIEATIKSVETANDARDEIAAPGPVGDRVRYDQCLRTARTRSLCSRFLPAGEAP